MMYRQAMGSAVVLITLQALAARGDTKDVLARGSDDSVDNLADKHVDRLIRRTLNLSSAYADLDGTTLSKANQLGMPRQTLAVSSMPHSPSPRHHTSSFSNAFSHPTSPRQQAIDGHSKSPGALVVHCSWRQSSLSSTRGAAYPARAMADAAETPTTALVLSPEAKEYYREVKGADLDAKLLEAAPADYFELLGIHEDATAQDVKSAYRRLQKVVHPDIAGEAATPFGAILNMAYNTLMDDVVREVYAAQAKAVKKEMGGSFDGRPVSTWAGEEREGRAIFVDETVCIGCKACTLNAPNTFAMETRHGRARCTTQWGDDEDTISAAMEMCPVDCIHWVQRGQLAVLEFSMKGCQREDIAIMARRRSGNMGAAASSQSPFTRAENMLKLRKEARAEQMRKKKLKAGEGVHDEVLVAAIAAAWLELPKTVRDSGWPELSGTAVH
eukprot:gnl/TRDRNA2_/TRDRNA2_49438_c0_seq1.p1 gnl/TRDRNA2_/TRDRNA2_49438_c0~~gnl/TRDRNA2_/TRDRNA2_49438_c0_seq1.p1  ORF type:complete len:442 (+),score=71.60 gnl/TRDRNA2_/TRDRNA2_49438_c0_seq1:42-1367(+)